MRLINFSKRKMPLDTKRIFRHFFLCLIFIKISLGQIKITVCTGTVYRAGKVVNYVT